jgi:phosphatidylserine decarboxylase
MSIIKEGYPFILFPFIAGLLLVIAPQITGLVTISGGISAVSFGLGILLVVFAAFCLFFFRDPAIAITQGEDLILSPCNGTVLAVQENEQEYIIRVFLSLFNVHLQRAPVEGMVKKVEHQDGTFLMAWDSQAHQLNEQNSITIENEQGTFVVRQIAGFLARRCVSWVKPGDGLKAGDKIGLIKFSSQVDLHVPKTIAVKVRTGDKVRAGITVVGVKGGAK